MSKKKKGKKTQDQDKDIVKSEVEETSEEVQEESTDASSGGKEKKSKKKKSKETGPTATISGKYAVKGIFLLFGFLAVFSLGSAAFCVKTNSFSTILLLGLAMGGFLLAFLTRNLAQSAYFNLFRVLSLLMFVPIALINFYSNNMNGFSFGLFGILAAGVMIAAIIPYFFEGISVENIALYSLSIFFALGFIYLLYSSSVLDSGEKTLYKKAIFPSGVVFEETGKTTWIFGDNHLTQKDKKEPVTFQILSDRHPDKVMDMNKEFKKNQAKNYRGSPNSKKKKNSSKSGNNSPSPEASKVEEKKAEEKPKEKEEFLALDITGENFSACPDRKGSMMAVAGDGIAESGNSVIVVTLPGLKKIEIVSKSDLHLFLPGFSATYPGYTTWNKNGNKFFFFGRNKDGLLSLFVGDVEKEESREVKCENILSACWTGDDELRIVTGQKEKKKDVYFENVYNFDITGGAVYRWSEGMETTEKISDIEGSVKRVIVHPLSGRIFTFDGENAGILDKDSTTFKKSSLNIIPPSFSSIISADGKLLAAKDGESVLIVNLETSEKSTPETTSDIIYNFMFTGDNRYLIYTSNSKSTLLYKYSVISLYDIQEKKLKKYTTNFMTGDFRAGKFSTLIPHGLLKYGYIYDPYKKGLYYNEINNMDEMSIWKITDLYPELAKSEAKNRKAVKKTEGKDGVN